MWSLQFRMWFLLAVFFAIIYMIVTMVGVTLGVTNFYFYLGFSLFLMFLQYLISPKIVEWSMGVRYVDEGESPALHQMVGELARKAGIPKPKVGISRMPIPNAFAFGRGASDGRICVTQGILSLLEENELRAVLGHEISHLKYRDVLTITLLSVVPMILYRIYWHTMWFGGSRDRRNGANAAVVGLAAFLFYFITNLLVLYASRLREYFADRGAILLGNRPEHLATALYKLVYGSARADKETLREAEGLKAFFLNDPSRAYNEIRELSQLDLDKSGTIDPVELQRLQSKTLRLSFADRALEVLSTHPNMLKRIRQLSAYEARG